MEGRTQPPYLYSRNFHTSKYDLYTETGPGITLMCGTRIIPDTLGFVIVGDPLVPRFVRSSAAS